MLKDIIEAEQKKAREKLHPQLTNTRGVKPEVLDFARLLLGDFWQAQQKDLDIIITETAQIVAREVREKTLIEVESALEDYFLSSYPIPDYKVAMGFIRANLQSLEDELLLNL